MEDLTKELHSHASAEPAQVSQPAHHRFYHTRLWSLIRGEIEITVHKRSRVDYRGVEKEIRANPPVINGSVQESLVAIFDEFLIELRGYCRGEKDLTERIRTLRFTRSGLITALFLRTPPGAEKKCGYIKARRSCARHLRRRSGGYSYGVGRAVCYRKQSRLQREMGGSWSKGKDFGFCQRIVPSWRTDHLRRHETIFRRRG